MSQSVEDGMSGRFGLGCCANIRKIISEFNILSRISESAQWLLPIFSGAVDSASAVAASPVTEGAIHVCQSQAISLEAQGFVRATLGSFLSCDGS